MISHDIFNSIVISWIGIAIVLFPILLKVTAPYGRHATKSWGPMIDNRLGWIIMEFPALALFGSLVVIGEGLNDRVVLAGFILWMIHYVNRTLIFPLRIKTKGKKMPVAIVAMAFFFNLMNGFVNGYWLGFLSPAYPDSWIRSPYFIIGLILFITGFLINQYTDNKLIRLRRDNGNKYVIPRGGLFNYISCPNFFGEIVEWAGFAILLWCLPAFSFFLWTAVNLIPRALDHHKWYLNHFTDYPKNRKAIIPFLV